MSEPVAADPSWDAGLYDARHSFVWRHGESLVDLLAPQPGESVLDLGCGTGHLTARLAATGAHVLGIDRSPDMIEQARRVYPNLGFARADARSLDYVAHFDGVFSNAALHWIKEADLVVKGVSRALKSGGRLVVEFGGKGNVQAIVAGLQAALRAVGGEAVEFPWYFPSVGEYAALLERHDLEVTLATLFERPTPLEGESGMRQWVEMFGGPFLGGVPSQRREEFFGRTEDALRSVLLRNGTWFADYRRLRVIARRLA